jgi:hypothetical protein
MASLPLIFYGAMMRWGRTFRKQARIGLLAAHAK